MTGTADVTLYGHWICPFATRVAFALAQRGVQHDLIEVPPTGVRPPDFEMPPEFVEHSPRREIPMVRVGEDYLADSIPILEWLERRIGHDSLLPATQVGQDLVRERMTWADTAIFRPMIGIYYGTDPERIRRASKKLVEALSEMDGWLSESAWLAGDVVTLAEAVYVPLLVRLDALRRLGFEGDLPPSVHEHAERCRSLRGWDAVAWSSDQEDEFVGRFEAYRRKQAARS